MAISNIGSNGKGKNIMKTISTREKKLPKHKTSPAEIWHTSQRKIILKKNQ